MRAVFHYPVNFRKSGIESGWSVADREGIAIAMAMGNAPQAVAIGLQKEYAERYDWLVSDKPKGNISNHAIPLSPPCSLCCSFFEASTASHRILAAPSRPRFLSSVLQSCPSSHYIPHQLPQDVSIRFPTKAYKNKRPCDFLLKTAAASCHICQFGI